MPFWQACVITSSLLVPMASSESNRRRGDMDAPGSFVMVDGWVDVKCNRKLEVQEG
jgi:hypothetical protein